ncbi:hypothetical protein JCM15519_21300 [Fundidesulfovibrio butyratiphilus]
MLHFPPIRRKQFRLPHVRPHNADLLSGIHGQPDFDWLLIESGIEPVVSNLVNPSASHHARLQHAQRRRDTSGRLVAWLEAHDPLFAATMNMLFDVTESWPSKMEHLFWKTINGKPIRFLDVYLEVRDIVDAMVEERAGQG